MVPLPSR